MNTHMGLFSSAFDTFCVFCLLLGSLAGKLGHVTVNRIVRSVFHKKQYDWSFCAAASDNRS